MAPMISSILSNSEAWYVLTKLEAEQLEQIDEMWIRNLFELSRNVPKDLLYFSAGTGPNFLYYKGKKTYVPAPPPSRLDTQSNLDAISSWADSNLMLLNMAKMVYTFFTRSREQFCTIHTVNSKIIEKKKPLSCLGYGEQPPSPDPGRMC